MAANALATVEALTGWLGFALATGLLFARFSRPTARIVFSRQAVVAPYGDFAALELRIANERANQIVELRAQMVFSRMETHGGRSGRRFYELALERPGVVFFPLSWTLVHPIDETSPLWGATDPELRAADAEVLVLLSGFDETFAQTVHARTSYKPEEIVWNARFGNVFVPIDDDQPLTIDLRRIHTVEPAGAPARLAADPPAT